VFPPTDFHTASLVDGHLVLIGCLGYPAERVPGFTPVYRLSLADYRIERVTTTGDAPGWVFHHGAEVDSAGRVITLRGGEVLAAPNDRRRFSTPNVEEYGLDTGAWSWQRLTRRNWRQFAVRPEDGKWMAYPSPDFEAFRPAGIRVEHLGREDWNRFRLTVSGVPLTLTVGGREVWCVVEGNLPEAEVRHLEEEACRFIEIAIGRACVLDGC
jgi:hypothetical protein